MPKNLNPELRRERARRYKDANPHYEMLEGARKRAREQGVQFSISKVDLIFPERCPVLDIPLFRSRGKPTDNSPTLDKIIPERGYVPGNIQIISYRANRIKNNATVDELQRIAAYMLSLSQSRPHV
ncbi:hypothetical protein ACVIRO_001244 [Rhizobium ruizarguesonis]